MTPLLVSVADLAAHPEWCILDCRHDLKNPDYGRQAYARGHIPGARFVHLDDDLSGEKTGSNGRHPLPERDSFARKVASLGIGADSRVIAYDNEGGIFAARLWWLLRWLGHENVALLDGGLAAWKRAKLPLEDLPPAQNPVACAPLPPLPPLPPIADMTVDAGQVLGILESADHLIIDARSPERFRGENETLDPLGGHIPGAVNRFYFDNLDDDGCFFKPAADLRREFDALLAGRAPGKVIQQCGSGVTACHNLLAMEIAGLSGSRLYPGSWSEWCADPSRPMALQRPGDVAA